MSLTKSEVRSAFREAAARSYAHIPPAEEIDHVFSESFYRRMESLVEEERRGSWRLLSRRRRRTLLVAAILTAALLLTACSPALREAVAELVVSIREELVEYRFKPGLNKELETIYVLDPVPEGFEFVSQTKHTAHYVETFYQDSQETPMTLSQAIAEDLNGIVDSEQGEILILNESNTPLLIYSSETLTSASWIFDGYYMHLFYFGYMGSNQIVSLITTLAPME